MLNAFLFSCTFISVTSFSGPITLSSAAQLSSKGGKFFSSPDIHQLLLSPSSYSSGEMTSPIFVKRVKRRGGGRGGSAGSGGRGSGGSESGFRFPAGGGGPLHNPLTGGFDSDTFFYLIMGGVTSSIVVICTIVAICRCCRGNREEPDSVECGNDDVVEYEEEEEVSPPKEKTNKTTS